MRAKLKALFSFHIDLKTYSPPDPERFCLRLNADIGLEDSEGADMFQIQVCTPKWLVEQQEQGALPEVVYGRHMMFVLSYDLRRITDALESYCEKCVGENWPEIAEKLARIGAWEFEDYH
jgi:hypothetical protein